MGSEANEVVHDDEKEQRCGVPPKRRWPGCERTRMSGRNTRPKRNRGRPHPLTGSTTFHTSWFPVRNRAVRSGDITQSAGIALVVLTPAVEADWAVPTGDLAWTCRWRVGCHAPSLIDIGIICLMMMKNLANLDRRTTDGMATRGSEEQTQ